MTTEKERQLETLSTRKQESFFVNKLHYLD